METAKRILIDFSKPGDKETWRNVNDIVMGGISQSRMIMTDDSTAIFQGDLSRPFQTGGWTFFLSADQTPNDLVLRLRDSL